MNLLIVLAHPDPDSFSRAVADGLARGATESGEHDSEIADLAREGFDPRMQAPDLAAYRTKVPPPEDVLREQTRIERADAIALVYPVYWWSMPALLKGWIDRVFTGGWAYEVDAAGHASGKLADRPIHLLQIGGADRAGYDKHGYRTAMETQIDQGIFHWCGLRSVHAHLLDESESPDGAVRSAHLEMAYQLGRTILAPPPDLAREVRAVPADRPADAAAHARP